MSVEIAFSELHYPTIATAGWDEETERARVRGHAAGYAEGLRAAEAGAATEVARARVEREALREHAAAALTNALDALGTAARRFDASAAPVLAAADGALLSAAIELAETIIGIELADGDTSARAAVSRVLSRSEQESVTAVRLSPVDLAVIESHTMSVPEVRLVADPTLSPGDAVVELQDGRLDARIAAALRRARAELGGAR